MVRQTVKNYKIINLFINKIQVYLQKYINKYFYIIPKRCDYNLIVPNI